MSHNSPYRVSGMIQGVVYGVIHIVLVRVCHIKTIYLQPGPPILQVLLNWWIFCIERATEVYSGPRKLIINPSGWTHWCIADYRWLY